MQPCLQFDSTNKHLICIRVFSKSVTHNIEDKANEATCFGRLSQHQAFFFENNKK